MDWTNLLWMAQGAILFSLGQHVYVAWKHGGKKKAHFQGDYLVMTEVKGSKIKKRKIKLCEPCADRMWNTACEYAETAEDDEDESPAWH